MSQTSQTHHAGSGEASAGLGSTRLLIPIFFVSGLSSLIYQVVWQRLLTLHYGVGSVSITLIVSVYMLGLGLGALIGGSLSERVRNGLLAYCVAELFIGAFGAVSLPFLGELARFTAGSSYTVSLLAMFVFLLVPTLLMGTTLPLLVKAFNRVAHDFLLSVSLLYFVNTLGAAFGALFTAYALISFWGLDSAIHFAVALNLLLAGAVYLIARRYEGAGTTAAAPDAARRSAETHVLGARVYPLVLASGFLAIGYELVWFRVIGILIKSSPYAFATSLAVYLLGIALGSYAVEVFLRRRPQISRVDLFFYFQFATGCAVVALVGSFSHLVESGPFARLAEDSFQRVQHPPSWQLGDLLAVLLWPVFFQLVPTLLIGASFPLLASLALSHPDREGATVGRVYFVNTIGNLLGGIVCGFVLLAVLGSERTLLAFAIVNLLFLLLAPRRSRATGALRAGVAAAGIALAVLVFPAPGELYAKLHQRPGPGFDAYLEEGVDGVIATFERGPRVVNYINGLEHGGRIEPFFLTQAMYAVAMTPHLESAFVLGFGTGTFAEVLLRRASLQRLRIVELNRTLMRNLVKMEVFRRILDDPRIDFVYDDGRRFLLSNDDVYDLVIMDPIRTTSAYSNNLYSVEFFQLVSRHLAECGVLQVWADDQFVLPRTMAEVFPHLVVYALPEGTGFVAASSCPISVDPVRVHQILNSAPIAERSVMSQRMKELRPVADRESLLAQSDGVRINRDFEPVSEYYLGRGDLDRVILERMEPR